MASAAKEQERLRAAERRVARWRRWGPYLSERQWATVREDYSADGNAWAYFPHDHARSRAYRWGEDGLLGVCDEDARLCFGFAFWNGKDAILKERLFGLANGEGNHGEDVKEEYWYLDSTPTHSWMKAAYRLALDEFPYERLLRENRSRNAAEPEFELADTGIFSGGRYADVVVEYAKADPDDLLVRLTVENRSAAAATLDVLGILWFRNTWSWGGEGEDHSPRPSIRRDALPAGGFVTSPHLGLAAFRLSADAGPGGPPELLLTNNETNAARLFGASDADPLKKDAFHEHVIRGPLEAVRAAQEGTKAAARWRVEAPARGSRVLRLRLSAADRAAARPFDAGFASTMDARRAEADAFYRDRLPAGLTEEQRSVARQACAGLLHSKQFYCLSVADWLAGDPGQPRPPERRKAGRNRDWRHLYNRDLLLMPDKWEYPWYAAWDLAFHAVALARIDPDFSREQILLPLREWYQHPNGQIPAYEWNFSDVNPPVHGWGAWRVYEETGEAGQRDRVFLSRVYQKLLLNFTWWVNRKDAAGRHLFSGGFLGLDNVGVFDRSMKLPDGTSLEQADGTAWMAFFSAAMLGMAVELAQEDPAYEDMATKFFEHFMAITDAMNGLGGTGLWDEEDGFYYDQVERNGRRLPMKVRSVVGLVPLFAALTLDAAHVERLPAFRRRTQWFVQHAKSRLEGITCLVPSSGGDARFLLAIPSRERLARVLSRVLHEEEFLSPYGVRSLSRRHEKHPFAIDVEGRKLEVAYEPAEGRGAMFGGNSNWRGPVWLPMNYLLIEALERYHRFYGDEFQIEMPTGSGRRVNLLEVSRELARRVVSLFLRDASGRRPCTAPAPGGIESPAEGDRILFHEYFDGDTGRGLGASHQSGWTALVVRLMERLADDKPARRR